MSEELPTGALHKKGFGKAKALMQNPFGGGGGGGDDDDNFSAIGGGDSTHTMQEMAGIAATGAANSYLQQQSYGVLGLGKGEDGSSAPNLTVGGFNIAGISPSSTAAVPSDLSRIGGGAAGNFLQSRTGGVLGYDGEQGLTVGGTAASTLSTNSDEVQRVAAAAANSYLHNKSGGLLSVGEQGQLSAKTGDILNKGLSPASGAIATTAANLALNERSGGMLSLDNKGNLQIKSNEVVDRRIQEARAAATVAGTNAVEGIGGLVAAGTTAINMSSSPADSNQREGTGGNFSGGAVFDVARSEFQARWARVVAEEERLRSQSLDIDRRERQLAMRTTKQAPNFPPLRFLCIKPVVHHDIAGAIPQSRQTFVKACYGTFYGTVLLLIANMVMIFVNVGTCGRSKLAAGDDTTFLKHLILPIFYALLGSLGAFFVWYHPTYSACGSGSSITYVMAFIGLFVAFSFAVFQSVGPLGYGGAGFLYAISSNDRCGISNLFMIVPVAILWACLAVCMFAYMIKLRLFYKEDSASLDAAREQLKAQLR